MRRPGALLPILALVGLAAAAVPATLHVSERHARTAERAAAVAAARIEVTNLLNLNYATARRDLDRIVAGATGSLAQQFAAERAHVEVLAQDRSVSSGSVIEAGLVAFDAGAGTARVAVAADARVSSASVTQPVVKQYRWLLTMRQVDGRWLASDAALAGVPR